MALIEREAAESAIAKLMPSFTPDGSGQFDEIIYYAQQMCGDAIETIRELPTINAAPVVYARWIEKETGCVCSRCGCGDGATNTRYCPDCGAKMFGGEGHG